MGISHAVEAYRQSAYRNLEYDIERSTASAGLPIIGGIFSEVKGLANRISRPVKVIGALTFGGDYSVDEQHVPLANLPDDIKHTPYANALAKVREGGRQSADLRAESVGKLLTGNVQSFFRMRRAASYNDVQRKQVILPDEGQVFWQPPSSQVQPALLH